MEEVFEMSLDVGTIYKRIIVTILFFIALLVLICTFTKYKICRFPNDIIHRNSINIEESKKLGVFIAEYQTKNKSFSFNDVHNEIESIWIEKVWHTKPYSDEVDNNSLRDSLNAFIIIFKNKFETENPLMFGITIENNDIVIGEGATLESKKVKSRYYSNLLPDTLYFKIYKSHSYLKNNLLVEKTLIKK